MAIQIGLTSSFIKSRLLNKILHREMLNQVNCFHRLCCKTQADGRLLWQFLTYETFPPFLQTNALGTHFHLLAMCQVMLHARGISVALLPEISQLLASIVLRIHCLGETPEFYEKANATASEILELSNLSQCNCSLNAKPDPYGQ